MAELSLNQIKNLVDNNYVTLTDAVNTKQNILIEDSTHRWFTDIERTKLNSIEAKAEVNQSSFGIVKIGSTLLNATSKIDSFELVAGTNLTLSGDPTTKRITINATAAPYTHPATHPATMITTDTTHRFITDAQISQLNSAASGQHTHVKSQITDFAHQHYGSDIVSTVSSSNSANISYNLPTYDVGGNVWISTTTTGVEGLTTATSFGTSTPPVNPGVGQIWFDTSRRIIKFFDGSSWQPFGAAYM